MNKTARLSAKNRAFMEKVTFVSFLVGIALFAAGGVWAYFVGIWFDAMMQDPAMHQYALVFSLVLHLPVWVCAALGGGALFATLTVIAMALLDAGMVWADTRFNRRSRHPSEGTPGQKMECTTKEEHHS